MKLIVGLGNPDQKYQNTRHNLGQKIIVDYLKNTQKSSFQEKKSLMANIFEIGESIDKIILATSTNYMNNSGVTVQKISQYYKIIPSNIYILHDDLDLPIGEYRIQFDRGPAGHNGVKSIIENLGTQAFNRVRIGIGKSINDIPVEDYVLQPFSKKESDIIKNITPKIFEEIKKILGP